MLRRRKMPGFSTEIVGTPTKREKARRYVHIRLGARRTEQTVRSAQPGMAMLRRRKMPGFSTEIVGTPTKREKARRYVHIWLGARRTARNGCPTRLKR